MQKVERVVCAGVGVARKGSYIGGKSGSGGGGGDKLRGDAFTARLGGDGGGSALLRGRQCRARGQPAVLFGRWGARLVLACVLLAARDAVCAGELAVALGESVSMTLGPEG